MEEIPAEVASTKPDSIGQVASIKGSKVTLHLTNREVSRRDRVTVGSFVQIRAGSADLVGIVTILTSDLDHDALRADLDLLGELTSAQAGHRTFVRGVTTYPAIGDCVHVLPDSDLRLVFQASGEKTIEIGHLHQTSMPACIKTDDLLSKHFAILGTTGVGKSSGVAIILDEILNSPKDVRVFLLDVHNEYASCFGDCASVINPRTLKLPFWLFNLEEMSDVIFAGRKAVDEEIEILAELIPIAKNKYAQYKDSGERGTSRRLSARGPGYTVDTPVPYLLQDLLSLIDERMGRLDSRVSRLNYHRLMTRIEGIRNDPRYGFMFENANVGGDTMGEILAHLFRLQPDGKPMTIMQLAGLPAEVVDAVVCVLCRLAFEFGIWSEGAIPLLFVCEEAHRYASADKSIGFSPTRRALSRIAREGRKHGIHLGLVTQRPAELDPTIISQCSTLFAMRMSNDRDQAFLAAAVTDAVNLLTFVPLLGTGEVIAFGEGVPLPTRMKFRDLAPHALPRGDVLGRTPQLAEATASAAFLGAVVERWRGATMHKQHGADLDMSDAARAVQAPGEGSSAVALDQAHRRLLRRNLEGSGSAQPGQKVGGSSLWQPQ